jgi:hypothetical protein
MKLRIDAPRPVLELVALFMELDALAVELLFNHLSGGRKGVRRSDVVRGKMRGGGRANGPPSFFTASAMLRQKGGEGRQLLCRLGHFARKSSGPTFRSYAPRTSAERG